MFQFEEPEGLPLNFKVVTTLFHSRRFLGVASYFENDNSILVDSFPSSMTETEGFIEFIKKTTKTTLFLLSASVVSNKGLLDLVVGEDTEDDQIPYQTLKTSCWQEVNAKSLIISSLRVRAPSHEDIGMDIMLYLSQVCDIECGEILQALGALVYYLSKEIFKFDRDQVLVSGISQFPKDNLLRMDRNTFQSLQIFKEDFHPNWIKGKGKSKEGFSLFTLFDRTLTTPGRRRLHEWMASPSYDMTLIFSRHDDVAFLIQDETQEVVNSISSHIKHTSDIAHLMLNIKKACMKPLDWCRLYRTFKEWIAILSVFSQIEPNTNTQSYLMNTFFDSARRDSTVILSELLRSIDTILDIPKCEEENAIVVVRGYNDLLDQKRDIFETIESELIRAAQMVLDLTPSLENLSVEYIPQLGFHVVVDAENWNLLLVHHCVDDSASTLSTGSTNTQYRPVSRDGSNNDSSIHGFRLSFYRDERYYLKHKVMDDMDETIGDIKSEILDLQKQSLLDLEEIIINQEVFIYFMIGSFASLDATMSLALVARENRLVRPQMVEDNVLIIKGGRHMLQELTVETFVPNDTFSGNDKNISIITGPNGSGKSIYLKQIGVITYLSHIGSFVPCENAVIGLTDRILTRISSEESVSVAQSTFTIDLCQMAKMFRNATKASLCLIDEFGKGTMPLDGIALLGAVLKHFVEMPCRTFCVLHLTEVLDRSLLSSSITNRINCFKMDSISNGAHKTVGDFGSGDDSDDDDELIPLYKLKVGRDADSEGIACAKSMGMKPKVIERAKQIKEAIKSGTPIPTQVQIRQLNGFELDFLRKLFDGKDIHENET